MIYLRSYGVRFRKDTYSQLLPQLTLEIHTQLEDFNKERYCKVVSEVIYYLGCEGFLDNQAPTNIEVFNKNGQVVPLPKPTDA